VATGFTSEIAHAGARPFQMWVLPKRPPRDVFVGTSAILFAVLNWIKVPTYIALEQFNRTNLLTSATWLPIALLASLAGVWLVRRVPLQRLLSTALEEVRSHASNASARLLMADTFCRRS
jgi:uncharacterized protein